jgi:Rod binding domain-containing protein
MIALGTNAASANVLVQADGAPRHAKLLRAAQEFEAVMLEVILKPLQKSSAIGGDEGDPGATGPLQSFGVEAVAGAMARSDALGFASRIVASVEKQDARVNAKKAAAETQVPLAVADISERR